MSSKHTYEELAERYVFFKKRHAVSLTLLLLLDLYLASAFRLIATIRSRTPLSTTTLNLGDARLHVVYGSDEIGSRTRINVRIPATYPTHP